MPKTFDVGIKGLIIHKNKEFLLKRQNGKNGTYLWDIPGGRMENGEDIADALRRELQEELPSIESIKINNLIGAFKRPTDLPDGQGLMLLVYGVNASLPRVTLSNEHCDYTWVGKDELELIAQEAHLREEIRALLNKSLN